MRIAAVNDTKVRALMVAAIVLLATFGAASTQEAAKSVVTGPVFSNTGPDAAGYYGAAEGYPLGTLATASQMRHLVASYSHFDELTPARIVARSAVPWSFKRAAEPEISYRYLGRDHTIVDYLSRYPTTGLLLARDDTIFVERYQYARSDRDRFLSQSMAKTITAMLIGIAAADGAIKSIDDEAAIYVAGLAGTEYGKTPIRALLHMSSGVEFKVSYNYDGQDISDAWGAIWSTARSPSPPSRSSTPASPCPARDFTTPVSRPRCWGSSCAPQPASRSPTI
jgi:CubicO group peptidase (beta-lactamase class C family)